MKAIIVVSGVIPELLGLDERTPSALLPLGDRPFLQHIIEHLAAAGLREFHFVVGHLPEKLEAYFGDGTRWGCKFRFHLATDAEQPYRPLRVLCAGLDDSVCLAHSDLFPVLAIEPYLTPRGLTAFELPGGEWSGCAVFEPNMLQAEWFEQGRSFLEASLRRDESVQWAAVEHFISLKTPLQLLASQQALLSGTFPSLLLGGASGEPGVWISRNVVIHPSAHISAPVCFGENCRVGRGAHIGPNVVLSRNCIIDEHSLVKDSLVMSGSYIGEGLELDQVIVDRNLLVNARLETSLFVSERFLLGGLTDRPHRSLAGQTMSALFATALLVVLLPFFLIAAAFRMAFGAARLRVNRVVELPASSDNRLWLTYPLYRVGPADNAGRDPQTGTTLFGDFVPGLLAVCRGKMALVGLPARTPQEVEALPGDWQKLYLEGVSGLITEASVSLDAGASDEELYLAEAFYTATRSWRRDAQLFCRFFLRHLMFSPQHRLDASQSGD